MALLHWRSKRKPEVTRPIFQDRAESAAANLEQQLAFEHRIVTHDHAATGIVRAWVERAARSEDWPRIAIATREGFSAYVPNQYAGLEVVTRAWPREAA
jgi:hypothetical protein